MANGAATFKTGGALGQLDISRQANIISPARLQLVMRQFWRGRAAEMHVMLGTIVVNADLVANAKFDTLVRVTQDHEPGPYAPASRLQAKRNRC